MTTPADISAAADNLSRSLAQLTATTAEYVRARVDDAGRGLRTEQRRHLWMLLGALALFLWLGTASLFAGFAIVAAFWDTNRVLAAAAVATGFLALAAIAGWVLWLNACRRVPAADWLARLVFLFAQYRRWSSR